MIKTAIITGSASGIGLEMARQLAIQGYHLYLVDVNQTALQNACNELQPLSPHPIYMQVMDLCEPQAAEHIFQTSMQQQFNIDVVISNAGFFFFSGVADADPEKSARMLQLHIHTPSMLAIYFGKYFRQKKSGHLLMVSSISAFKDFPGIGFYAASKAYIKSFCRSLRYELKYHGVHVTTLCPGATATNLYDPNVINIELGKKLGIMMSAQSVARAGLRGMFRNRAMVIPGFITRLMTWGALLTPNWLIYAARIRYKRFFND